MVRRLLKFLTFGKVPVPTGASWAGRVPTTCHCGEPSKIANVRVDHSKLGLFLFAYCEGCFERMRQMNTTSQIIFNEKVAAQMKSQFSNPSVQIGTLDSPSAPVLAGLEPASLDSTVNFRVGQAGEFDSLFQT